MDDIQYELVQFGERSPKKRDVVFVWIYAKNCSSYDGYPYNDIPVTSLVLGQLRWDGSIGAVGGGVDKGEELVEAAIRECIEEIAFAPEADKLQELCTRRNPKSNVHIHTWGYEVSYEELKHIRNNASTAEHFNAECGGVFLMHTCRYKSSSGKEVGWNILQQHVFVGTAKMDLQLLVEKNDLIVDYFNAK